MECRAEKFRIFGLTLAILLEGRAYAVTPATSEQIFCPAHFFIEGEVQDVKLVSCRTLSAGSSSVRTCSVNATIKTTQILAINPNSSSPGPISPPPSVGSLVKTIATMYDRRLPPDQLWRKPNPTDRGRYFTITPSAGEFATEQDVADQLIGHSFGFAVLGANGEGLLVDVWPTTEWRETVDSLHCPGIVNGADK